MVHYGVNYTTAQSSDMSHTNESFVKFKQRSKQKGKLRLSASTPGSTIGTFGGGGVGESGYLVLTQWRTEPEVCPHLYSTAASPFTKHSSFSSSSRFSSRRCHCTVAAALGTTAMAWICLLIRAEQTDERSMSAEFMHSRHGQSSLCSMDGFSGLQVRKLFYTCLSTRIHGHPKENIIVMVFAL